MDCPRCGNPVDRIITDNVSFMLDTVGTFGFCVTDDTIYIHMYEDIKDSREEFDSFNPSTEKV